jgi:hypothetical protein
MAGSTGARSTCNTFGLRSGQRGKLSRQAHGIDQFPGIAQTNGPGHGNGIGRNQTAVDVNPVAPDGLHVPRVNASIQQGGGNSRGRNGLSDAGIGAQNKQPVHINPIRLDTSAKVSTARSM